MTERPCKLCNRDIVVSEHNGKPIALHPVGRFWKRSGNGWGWEEGQGLYVDHAEMCLKYEADGGNDGE